MPKAAGVGDVAGTAHSSPCERGGCIADAQISIHDSSRVEWAVTLPLPETGGGRYFIEARLEIPTHIFVPHSPWQQLQAFGRLDWFGPAVAGQPRELDAIRREVLETDDQLTRAVEGFRRHCADARTGTLEENAPALTVWVCAAITAVEKSRGRLRDAGSTAALRQERDLAEEYLSVRAIGAFTRLARELEQTSRQTGQGLLSEALTEVRGVLLAAIEAESEYRAKRGFVRADADRAADLEEYQRRASELKKHFEASLYLRRECRASQERVQPWVAWFAAAMAGVGAFLLQMLLARGAVAASSGLLFLALVAGVSYAVRDRMKEVGRVWLASGIQRFAAQRFTRFTLASGRAVVTARESFDELTTPHSDPLGSELGTTGTDTHLKFVHAGTIHDVGLSDASHCLRMLFRYDLTPLLPRLHDAVKQLAVRDSETGKLRFVDAPRTYRVPVRLRVLYQGILEERSAVLVINKYGLHRLDRAVSI